MTLYGVCDNKCLKPINEYFSNPNLLINSDFQVNQDGFTSLNSDGGNNTYLLDGWLKSWGNSLITLVDDGLKIQNKGTGGAPIHQFIECDLDYYLGQTLTFSVSVNGVIHFVTGTLSETNIKYDTSNFGMYFGADTTRGCIVARIYANEGATITVNWLQLEPGPIPTKHIRRHIAEDLALCQRYKQQGFICIPVLNNQGGWYEFPVEMRATPTVTYSSISFGVAGSALQTSFNGSTIYESSRTKDRIIFAQNFRDGVVALRCVVYCDARIY